MTAADTVAGAIVLPPSDTAGGTGVTLSEQVLAGVEVQTPAPYRVNRLE